MPKPKLTSSTGVMTEQLPGATTQSKENPCCICLDSVKIEEPKTVDSKTDAIQFKCCKQGIHLDCLQECVEKIPVRKDARDLCPYCRTVIDYKFIGKQLCPKKKSFKEALPWWLYEAIVINPDNLGKIGPNGKAVDHDSDDDETRPKREPDRS